MNNPISILDVIAFKSICFDDDLQNYKD